MESLILGDPGEVSRDDRMFVVKVYRKTFTTNILSSRLIAPRSSRLRISETKIHSKNNLRWQIIKQNDAELSVIFFFFRIETIATQTIGRNAENIEYLQFT